MMSAPRESAVPGLPDRATRAPLRRRVIESPGVAPVTQASSTEPFACSVTSAGALAADASAVIAVPAAKEADTSATTHLASTRQLDTVPPFAHDGRTRSGAAPLLPSRSWHGVERSPGDAGLGGLSLVLCYTCNRESRCLQ